MDFKQNRTGPQEGRNLTVIGALVCCVSMFGMLAGAEKPPRMGDIIRFYGRTKESLKQADPNQPMPPRLDIPATVISSQGVGEPVLGKMCQLSSDAMSVSGGSLLVYRVEANLGFAVHWQGGATSDAKRDCGPEADLLVGDRELAELANFGERLAPLPAQRVSEGGKAPVGVPY